VTKHGSGVRKKGRRGKRPKLSSLDGGVGAKHNNNARRTDTTKARRKEVAGDLKVKKERGGGNGETV